MFEHNIGLSTEATARLTEISDQALREMCDFTDDMILIAHKYGEAKVSEQMTKLLIDLVLEEERRNSCVQSCT